MVEDPPAVTIHPEDPDDEWQTADNTGRVLRVRAVTGALLALVVLAGGFWGGVVAEKHHGSGSSASASLASRFAAARAAGSGAAGGGTSFAGGGAGATTGTVIDVQGDVIDISDSSGNIVKVMVGPSTSVTRTAKSSVSGVQVGDTLIATGTTGSGGIVSATSVRASAPGVAASSGSGGLGSFGGRGAAGGG